MIKTFLFDIGNVVWEFRPLQKELLTRWAKLLGTDYDSLFQTFLTVYKDFETDALNLSDFLISKGHDPQPFLKVLNEVYSLDNFQKHLLPGTLKIISDLKDRGYELAYLSNAENFLYPYIHSRLNPLFAFGLTSWEVKSRKPDSKIFKQVLKHTQSKASEIYFVDDVKENVAAAKNFGFKAYHFISPSLLAKDLSRFL